MLTIVYVTLMYGAAMPILIVYGFGGLFCLFIVERHMLYYGYQAPPMYDEKLNNLALNIIQKSPLVCLPFSFWMFGNLQLLQENYMPITNASDPMYTGHVFSWDMLYTNLMTPSGIHILFWEVFVVIFLFSKVIEKFIFKIFPSMDFSNHIEENVDNFFKSLDDEDRDWSIQEHKNAKNELGINLFDQDMIQKLNSIKGDGSATIQGVHSYDILANPQYFDDFLYFPANLPDRADYIIDNDEDEGNDAAQSDLVRLVLNLAFLTEAKAKSFKFQKDTISSMKQNLMRQIG